MYISKLKIYFLIYKLNFSNFSQEYKKYRLYHLMEVLFFLIVILNKVEKSKDNARSRKIRPCLVEKMDPV